jgi:superfamily II DNA or RNA helicase
MMSLLTVAGSITPPATVPKGGQMVFDVQPLLAKTNAEARPYQERIVSKVVTGFTEQNLRSIMIDSPTGSGKSVMGLLICKAMQELHGANIGWVSMRRNLLAQAARENEIKGFGVKMHMISMFDKRPPTGLDMLVIDEAQHDAAGSMGHIHAKVQPKWSLGMTATPFRADRVKLCFDKVIKDAGIHRLIQDGYLSPYHHFIIPDWKPDTVVDFYLKDRARWGKSLIYFHTLKDCWHVWQLLSEANVPCDVVTGDNRKCAKLIDDFYNNKLEVLINCAKLTEGFDMPDLRTVFARPSIKSVTIQMGGRVFRRHPDIRFKQIVQSADTKWPFTRTAGAALMHVYVDGHWRTIQPNDQVEEVAKRARLAMATSTAELPTFVTNQTKKSKVRLGQNKPAGRFRNPDEGNELPTSGVEDIPDNEEIQGAGRPGDLRSRRLNNRSAFDV